MSPFNPAELPPSGAILVKSDATVVVFLAAESDGHLHCIEPLGEKLRLSVGQVAGWFQPTFPLDEGDLRAHKGS